MSRIASKQAFQILGVTPTDDFATIRRAWIKLVKENHPDVAGGDLDELTARLTRINDAYDSLRWHNPEKVRIREENQAEADRRADKAGRRADGPRHGDPSRRAASQGPDHTQTHQKPARQTDPERRATPDRRQKRNGTIHDRAELAWASLSVDAKFKAAQSLCGAEPDQRTRQRRLATV